SGVGAQGSGPAPDPQSLTPDPFEQIFHEPQRRLRARVAAVEPGVDGQGQLVAPAERHGGEEVLIEGVHAAAADEAEQMQPAAALLHAAAQLHQRRQAEEIARLNGLRDPHDVLRDDAPGAEVQMTHFAVAHLAVGKYYGEPGRVQERARRPAPEAMPDGSVAELDGVALAAGTKAPAVEH